MGRSAADPLWCRGPGARQPRAFGLAVSGRFAAHLLGYVREALQVARFMAALANGGILWRPRLVQRLDPAGGDTLRLQPELAGRVDMSPAVLAVLHQSLWSAVNEGGTGAGARLPTLAVAGKTGTAQLVRESDSGRGQDHAWFAGYAPSDDPEVVVVVLVERGGMGGRVAAPIAREIFREIFRPAGVERPA